MSYVVTHNTGAMQADPGLDALPGLLDELAFSDQNNPDVAVSDERGPTLSVFGSGRVVYEDVEAEQGEPRHLDGLSREQTLQLLTALAEGRLDDVESQPWAPGYGRSDTGR